MPHDESTWLPMLRDAASRAGRELRFMEVCGTHTVSAFRCGLHSLLPDNVQLLSGPGCPVCVTAPGDIDHLIQLATTPNVTLFTYGDMLRVTGSDRRSLDAARGQGADVRVAYSALDAVDFAATHADRQVVFAAVGFETTTPPTAAAVLEAQRRGLTNFTVHASHKLVMPAMHTLLQSGDVRVDGLLCPGHVAVIIGADVFRPLVTDYSLPCVVVGFEDFQIGLGIAQLTSLCVGRAPALINQYPQAVTPGGNVHAQRLVASVFEPAEVAWRGLGRVPASGLVLRPEFDSFDARKRFNLQETDVPEPKGCRCGDVITGRCSPIDCKLFATACTPSNPIGPCMVSSEGTCQAHFKYGRHRAARRQLAVV
ncbi:MAG: hydrogenase formation protein HypD [Tepidisphaeraceae bacterium]